MMKRNNLAVAFFFSFLFFQLTLSQGSWTELNSSPPLTARCCTPGMYNSVSNSMFIFGGASNPVGTSVYGDFWEYFISNNSWIKVTPSSLPSARYFHSGIYVSSSNSLLIFGGGLQGGTSFLNDLWEYFISNNTWIQLTPPNPIPFARGANSAIYVPSSNSMLMFGGYTYMSCCGNVVYGNFWEYFISNNSWVELSFSASPGPRSHHSAVYIPSSNSMIIFGGYDVWSALNDLWQYFISNNTWTQLTPSNNPLSRYDQTVIYSFYSNSLVLFGGTNYLKTTCYNDLWEYSISGTAWIQINPSNSPPGRAGQSVVYDSSSHTMFIYGGYSYINKTWITLSDFWSFTVPLLTTQQMTTQQTSTQTTNGEQTTEILTVTPIIVTNNSNLGVIIGAILGSVLGILLVGILILILILRKKKLIQIFK